VKRHDRRISSVRESAFQWTTDTVSDALGVDASGAGDSCEFAVIVTDSRRIREGDVFVALRGDTFDGHDYVAEAAAAGARAVVVSQVVDHTDELIRYQVRDTLVALGDLARYRRRALPARVVGITGSSGKTGTKEFVCAALSTTLRVHATEGNFNNRIGVPHTLLAAPTDAELLVVEMGTNLPGEIAELTRIVGPEVAVVTTVSESHLTGLGDLEGVMREKLSIFDALPVDGVAIVGDVPPELATGARSEVVDLRVAGTGSSADPRLRASGLNQDDGGCWAFSWMDHRVQLARPGRHQVGNAAVALAVADAFGIVPDVALAAIGRVGSGTMRGEVLALGDLRLIVDCYNANPQSTRAALNTLRDWPGAGRRVAILGSMLELGDRTGGLHAELLVEAVRGGIALVVATGAFSDVPALTVPDGVRLERVPDPSDVPSVLVESLREDDVVLLKGSRGVHLEQLIPFFQRHMRSHGAESGGAELGGAELDGGGARGSGSGEVN